MTKVTCEVEQWHRSKQNFLVALHWPVNTELCGMRLQVLLVLILWCPLRLATHCTQAQSDWT